MSSTTTTIPRVVFVDDEPAVLAGLRRQLHGHTNEWSMAFYDQPDAALSAIATNAPAVVISDLRMPGMDGEDLLRAVAKVAPGTIRIALSGYHQREAAIKASGLVHRFVTKPVAAMDLAALVTEAIALRSLLSDHLRAADLNQLCVLPGEPSCVAAFTDALRRGVDDLGALVPILGGDAATQMVLLKLANSPMISDKAPCHDVLTALSRIGIDRLRSLVLMAGWLTSRAQPDLARASRVAATAHLAARVACDLGGDAARCRAAELAVHCCALGPIIAESLGYPLGTAEDQAREAAYVTGLWNLPTELVAAVADHLGPLPHDMARPVTTAVWIAHALMDQRQIADVPEAWSEHLVNWCAIAAGGV